MYPIVKTLLSAFLITLISWVSKKSTLMGAIFASIPLVSILAMIWLYIDTKDIDAIGQLSQSIFWMVLPSLPMFLIIPRLLPRFGFPLSLFLGCLLTTLLYGVMIQILTRFGVSL